MVKIFVIKLQNSTTAIQIEVFKESPIFHIHSTWL